MVYSSMSNVNTFRLIFDYYFGTEFGFLQDKCYMRGLFPCLEGPLTPDEINSISFPDKSPLTRDGFLR